MLEFSISTSTQCNLRGHVLVQYLKLFTLQTAIDHDRLNNVNTKLWRKKKNSNERFIFRPLQLQCEHSEYLDTNRKWMAYYIQGGDVLMVSMKDTQMEEIRTIT